MKVLVGYSVFREKEVEISKDLLDNENELCNFLLNTLGDEVDVLYCVKHPKEDKFYYEW